MLRWVHSWFIGSREAHRLKIPPSGGRGAPSEQHIASGAFGPKGQIPRSSPKPVPRWVRLPRSVWPSGRISGGPRGVSPPLRPDPLLFSRPASGWKHHATTTTRRSRPLRQRLESQRQRTAPRCRCRLPHSRGTSLSSHVYPCGVSLQGGTYPRSCRWVAPRQLGGSNRRPLHPQSTGVGRPQPHRSSNRSTDPWRAQRCQSHGAYTAAAPQIEGAHHRLTITRHLAGIAPSTFVGPLH